MNCSRAQTRKGEEIKPNSLSKANAAAALLSSSSIANNFNILGMHHHRFMIDDTYATSVKTTLPLRFILNSLCEYIDDYTVGLVLSVWNRNGWFKC